MKMQALPADNTESRTQERHRLHEDAIALVIGTMLVALGITFYAQAGILTSGLAGLSLLLDYASGYGFPLIFFAINVPFFLLALRRLGLAATLRTILAIGLVSVFARYTPEWVRVDAINPLYAALFGGAVIGVGLLVLFRHRTGLGGINLVAIDLQERFGLRAGYVLLAVDLIILAAAAAFLPVEKLALSVLGAGVLNMILALNHRPERYRGRS
ncbi:MAG: YitT family protein [Salinarimonas sp.]|nr:YitT family protein [Salinarimonas sp.]